MLHKTEEKHNQNHKLSDFSPLLYVRETLRWSGGDYPSFPSQYEALRFRRAVSENHVVNFKTNDVTVPNDYSWPRRTSLTSFVKEKRINAPTSFGFLLPITTILSCAKLRTHRKYSGLQNNVGGDKGRWAPTLKQLNPRNIKRLRGPTDADSCWFVQLCKTKRVKTKTPSQTNVKRP